MRVKGGRVGGACESREKKKERLVGGGRTFFFSQFPPSPFMGLTKAEPMHNEYSSVLRTTNEQKNIGKLVEFVRMFEFEDALTNSSQRIWLCNENFAFLNLLNLSYLVRPLPFKSIIH